MRALTRFFMMRVKGDSKWGLLRSEVGGSDSSVEMFFQCPARWMGGSLVYRKLVGSGLSSGRGFRRRGMLVSAWVVFWVFGEGVQSRILLCITYIV